MVDSGCTKTLVYQPRALLEAEYVEVVRVHGGIHEYPIVLLQIKHKIHIVKTEVSLCLRHPLILGTDLITCRGSVWGCVDDLWRCVVSVLCSVVTCGRPTLTLGRRRQQGILVRPAATGDSLHGRVSTRALSWWHPNKSYDQVINPVVMLHQQSIQILPPPGPVRHCLPQKCNRKGQQIIWSYAPQKNPCIGESINTELRIGGGWLHWLFEILIGRFNKVNSNKM